METDPRLRSRLLRGDCLRILRGVSRRAVDVWSSTSWIGGGAHEATFAVRTESDTPADGTDFAHS